MHFIPQPSGIWNDMAYSRLTASLVLVVLLATSTLGSTSADEANELKLKSNESQQEQRDLKNQTNSTRICPKVNDSNRVINNSNEMISFTDELYLYLPTLDDSLEELYESAAQTNTVQIASGDHNKLASIEHIGRTQTRQMDAEQIPHCVGHLENDNAFEWVCKRTGQVPQSLWPKPTKL